MNNIYDFSPGTDYKIAFRLAVDALYQRGGSLAERKAAVETLTSEYIAQTGERPDAVQLDRLSTWLLQGEAAEREGAA